MSDSSDGDGPEGTDEPATGNTQPTATDTNAQPTATDADTQPMATDTNTDTQSEDEQGLQTDVERYVRYLLVGGLALLALIALIRFYFAASTTIDTWISSDYRSLFQALFNLIILLLAGAGIAWQARKVN